MPALGGQTTPQETGQGQQVDNTQQLVTPVQTPVPSPTPVANPYTAIPTPSAGFSVPGPSQVNNPYGTVSQGVQQTPTAGASLPNDTTATSPPQQTTATLADVFGGPPQGLYPSYSSLVNPGFSTPSGNPIYAPGPAPGQVGSTQTGYTTGNPTGGFP
eukprot:TRINITY_DN2112_c0_g1_i8.p3 TRINITY_DN2112_c0_g1~~TRINITY_DN2112_c0_g1_i8.p3  ORF type:complete len:158 (+),score=24.29 TRINITY_DN2112_c0_g1_i8:317-790(+)